MNILAFQEEGLPLRTLRLGVFFDSTYSEEEVVHLVDEASTALEEQLGIHLEVVYNRPINLQKIECDLMLDELRGSALRVPDSVDVAVAFVRSKFPGSLFMWKGATDDSYRRYIILRGTAKVLIHEIGHCFIFSHSHSSRGVMKSTPSTTYFSSEDREEILENKWRNFNEKPDLDERDRINLLREDR